MHRKLKTFRKCAGLTLIEVVIASMLLVVVIIPILKSLALAHASSVKVEHKTRSLVFAQGKLEEIRAKSIYDFTNSGASFTQSNTDLGNSYLCNVTDNSGDPLKEVTVSVGYDSNGDGTLSGGEVNASISTLVARRWSD